MTAVAKLPEKWRNEADSIHAPPYDDSENSSRAIAMHCCADELTAALSPAELGGVEAEPVAYARVHSKAEPHYHDVVLPDSQEAEMWAYDLIPLYTATPRAAEPGEGA